MKHILYIVAALFLLASCRQEESVEAGKGVLSLSSIEVQAEVFTPITTRAVSPDLAIEILKEDGTAVVKYDAGAAETAGKIELDAGNYILKAYSPNYGTTWSNDEKGAPVYYKEQAFTIVKEKTNYLSLQVPMVNIGMRLILPEGFSDRFIGYTFSAQVGNREVALQEGETAYFDLPEDSGVKLQYSLSATNNDDETLQQDSSFEGALTAGTVYEVTYSIATNSLSLKRAHSTLF